ncbi:hypothetical protein CDV55_106939 [Aspergillus turcosus]|nr:hypothetical protein CDV55_106939 [Aspergillus turcosus]
MPRIARLIGVLLCFTLFDHARGVPDIQTLFATGDANTQGGCYSSLATLNTYLGEARDMLSAAQTALAEWEDNINYQELLMAYMGISFSKFGPGGVMTNDGELKFETVETRISNVASFLNGVTLSDPNGDDYTPHLWCSTQCGQSFEWDSSAFDSQGQPLEIPDTDPKEYYSISQAYGNLKTKSNRPFWLPDLNGYIFFEGTKSYPVNEDTNQPWTNMCAPPNAYAYTSKESALPRIPSLSSSVFGKNIFLCPKSFDSTGFHGLASLSNANYPTPGTKKALDHFAPRSATLYHELFHLTVPDGDSPDSFMEIAEMIFASVKGSASQKKQVVQNPESYVYFSLACWFYQNAPAGMNPVTFIPPFGYPEMAS